MHYIIFMIFYGFFSAYAMPPEVLENLSSDVRQMKTDALRLNATNSGEDKKLSAKFLCVRNFLWKYFDDVQEAHIPELIVSQHFWKKFLKFYSSILSGSFKKSSQASKLLEKSALFFRKFDMKILENKCFLDFINEKNDMILKYYAASLEIDTDKPDENVNTIFSAIFFHNDMSVVLQKLEHYFFSYDSEWQKKIDVNNCSCIVSSYIKSSQLKKAKHICLQAISILKEKKSTKHRSKDLVSLYLQLGYIFWCEKDYIQSLVVLQDVGSLSVKKYSTSQIELLVRLYVALGNAFFSFKKYSLTCLAFERALHYKSLHFGVHIENLETLYAHLGFCLFYFKKYKRSKASLQKALELGRSNIDLIPTNLVEKIEVYLALGSAYFMLQEYSNAFYACHKVLDIYKSYSSLNKQTLETVYLMLAFIALHE